MSHGQWEPGWGGDGEQPARLPRTSDLPVAEEGYDRAAVERAFDAFYRHAASLDANLRALEAVDAFQRHAAELRADLRALRTASWGPMPTRPMWTEDYAGQRRSRGGGGLGLQVVPRLAVEAAFIIVVAVGAALADVSTALIVLLVLAAWLLVGLGELVISTARPSYRQAPAPVYAAPASQAPTESEPQPAPSPGEDTEEAMLAAPAPALSEPEPEPSEERAQAAETPAAPEAKPRGFWRRRRREPEPEPEPEPLPRHIRVLPSQPTEVAVDPWERGPDELVSEDELEAEAESEVAAVEESEPEPEPEPTDEEPAPAPEPELEPEPETSEPAPVHLLADADGPPGAPPDDTLSDVIAGPERQPEPRRVRLRRGRR